ncbi:MAG: hypothetical protein NTY12_04585 [Candidatus Falkowbacteria bacterium]|nr:hypothetical protein [Candidatus Falkowbacteria bacterium]
MTNPNLAQSILHRVTDDKLKPKPRWQFITKQILIWFGVLLSVVVGSISSSILFFLIINNDWEAYDLVTKNLAYFILLTLPYFWLVILAGFIVLAYFYMRKTKHGYRYSLLRLSIIYLVLCSIIGGTAYAYGGSEEIDRLLTVNVPIYKKIVNQQTNRWSQPKAGLISGELKKVDTEKKELILEDADDNVWRIDYSKSKLNEKIKLNKGERIRIIGDEEDKENFKAKDILVNKPTIHKRNKKKD